MTELTTITPDQFKMLTDSIDQLKLMVDHLTGLIWTVLVAQAVIAAGLFWAHGRITRNQAITADLLRQGVAQIESDLPGAGGGRK